MKTIILLISILLMGCTTESIDMKKTCEDICLLDGFDYGKFVDIGYCNCFNKTIIINDTTYLTNTTIINANCSNITLSKGREMELIRRIAFLEGQTDKYFNDSECNDDLNNTRVELEDCKEELCYEWNSSWC